MQTARGVARREPGRVPWLKGEGAAPRAGEDAGRGPGTSGREGTRCGDG